MPCVIGKVAGVGITNLVILTHVRTGAEPRQTGQVPSRLRFQSQRVGTYACNDDVLRAIGLRTVIGIFHEKISSSECSQSGILIGLWIIKKLPGSAG